MKPALRKAGAALCAALALGILGVWSLAFRAPPVRLLPLPDGLIALESPAGQALLASSRSRADYAALAQNLETQARRAFCGVASSVTVLNALRGARPPLTQGAFFTDEASQVRGELTVTFGGVTLAQLAGLLRAHGAQAAEVYASDTSVEAFRALAQENLSRPGDYLLINYQRAALGQKETGHVSPLAAYNAEADRWLILDVATYKYPPVWILTGDLWRAMSAVDPSSGRSRGFVSVRGAP